MNCGATALSQRKHLNSVELILFDSVSEHFLIDSGMLDSSDFVKEHTHER